MGELIRILLVNDYRIMREGVRCLIGSRPEMTVVGEAGRVKPEPRKLCAIIAPISLWL